MTVESCGMPLRDETHYFWQEDAFQKILYISNGIKPISINHLSDLSPNSLSLFVHSNLSTEEKKRLLVAACSQREFRQLMKKLFINDFRTFVFILEILHKENKASGVINWIILRLASDWPELLIEYLNELSCDNERREKWNFILPFFSSSIKSQVFLYFEWRYGPDMFYEFFVLIEDSLHQKLLLESIVGEHVSEIIDGLIVYMISLESGSSKQMVISCIKRLLLEYGNYGQSLEISGKISPVGYLFAKNYLVDHRRLICEVEMGLDINFWCKQLDILWSTDFTTEQKCNVISELMDVLTLEQCVSLMIKAHTKNPHLLSILLICCSYSKFQILKNDFHIYLSKMIKITSSIDVQLYEYIKEKKRDQVSWLQKLQPIHHRKNMPPFFYGLYMLSVDTRKVILNNIKLLDTAQLCAASAAWPSSNFLSEFFSIEKKLSLKQYEVILKHCSFDNLEKYLNSIGRQVKKEYKKVSEDYENYMYEIDELLYKSLTDIIIWKYLTTRYFEVTRRISFLLQWKKMPIMIERSVVLYNEDSRFFENYEFLSIQKIYNKSIDLLNSVPQAIMFTI